MLPALGKRPTTSTPSRKRTFGIARTRRRIEPSSRGLLCAWKTGAPSQSTLVYLLYFYQTGFRFYEMGYASALIWVLLVAILLLTAALFKSSDLWVFYESEVKK